MAERSLPRRIIGGIFAWFGFAVALLIVIAVGAGLWLAPHATKIENGTVLTLDLSEEFPDGPPQSVLERALFGATPSLTEAVATLDQAAADNRIKGVVARLGDGLTLAQIQEWRDAIAAFRTTGKFAYAYADALGELGGGTGGYYLATAFDRIWLQAYSTLGFVGLHAEQPFLHDTLDKIGVAPRFDHREEYKSAMNLLTETKMTPAQREETDSLLASLFGQIARGIAERRQLSENQVRALVDQGPFSSEEALAAHLIDHIGGRDDAVGAAGPAKFVSLTKYAASVGRAHRTGPTIAVIYANGLIERGSGESDSPLNTASGVAGDRLARAFRDAAADSDVRAILFRIDSPGGSAVASETIWEATLRAKEAHKPLIVSMGDVAGSGGYYIAAAADKIVAEPATLTGSIGVVGGKFLINGLSDKLGITWDSAQIGANAGLLSMTEDFSAAGHERFERFLDLVYGGFKDRVAQGRKLDPAKVEEVAKGRVWTGEDAKARGLVDALGGFDVALGLAKEAAGIPASSDVTLTKFPKRERRLWRQLLDSAENDTVLVAVRPLVQTLRLLTAPPGALTMPPLEIR
jgi:protease IV